MNKENKPDRCYFCGMSARYKFRMKVAVCTIHWGQMYHVNVPDYVDKSQILQFKRLALEKKYGKYNYKL